MPSLRGARRSGQRGRRSCSYRRRARRLLHSTPQRGRRAAHLMDGIETLALVLGTFTAGVLVSWLNGRFRR